ncbi:hypothetical protein P5673_011236 [Acropora cervicornis]|uniref:Uncharacterized protein n=1 Tax=Acropora cervicornis TaxID=6130 RepID=A0AAD9V934_ACRCE|nr:hypothetical protein P5673_011236 [Acropora cervicornis]
MKQGLIVGEVTYDTTFSTFECGGLHTVHTRISSNFYRRWTPKLENLTLADCDAWYVFKAMCQDSYGPEKANYGTASFTFKKEKCAARSRSLAERDDIDEFMAVVPKSGHRLLIKRIIKEERPRADLEAQSKTLTKG